MTIETIMAVVTGVVTYVTGLLTKDTIIESKYVPLQNIIIGLVTGVLAYCCGLGDNLLVIIMNCMIGAMGAGGTYDLLQSKNK